MSQVEVQKTAEQQSEPQQLYFLVEGCPKEILDNPDLLREILTNAPEDLGLTAETSASVRDNDASNPIDRGHSGFILTEEIGQITIHALPEREIASGDFIVRSKEEEERFKNYLQEKFQGHSVKTLPVESTPEEREEFFAPISKD